METLVIQLGFLIIHLFTYSKLYTVILNFFDRIRFHSPFDLLLTLNFQVDQRPVNLYMYVFPTLMKSNGYNVFDVNAPVGLLINEQMSVSFYSLNSIKQK